MTQAKVFFFAHKLTIILAAVLLLILGSFVFFLSSRFNAKSQSVELVDVDLPFDPEGAYALLIPRRDGHALNLDLRRVNSYEAFSYQIAYLDDKGIERGAGDLNTWISVDKNRSSYSQEILFGTCSKGQTTDPRHCVFDSGVSNGTLTLRLRQGNKAYKMISTWHLQKPDQDLGKITSADNHFSYTVKEGDSDVSRQALSITAFSLVNDLSGVPKLPEGKSVAGKVYALNIPSAKTILPGSVKIELSDNPAASAQIGQYVERDNKWSLLETKIQGNILSTQASQEGIFTILVNSAKK